MSEVVSELLVTVRRAEGAGLLLMYHWSLATGRDPSRLQLSRRKSPGEADTGGLGRMRGPEGMTGGEVSLGLNTDISSPTTDRMAAPVTVSKSGNSLLTSHL